MKPTITLEELRADHERVAVLLEEHEVVSVTDAEGKERFTLHVPKALPCCPTCDQPIDEDLQKELAQRKRLTAHALVNRLVWEAVEGPIAFLNDEITDGVDQDSRIRARAAGWEAAQPFFDEMLDRIGAVRKLIEHAKRWRVGIGDTGEGGYSPTRNLVEAIDALSEQASL